MSGWPFLHSRLLNSHLKENSRKKLKPPDLSRARSLLRAQQPAPTPPGLPELIGTGSGGFVAHGDFRAEERIRPFQSFNSGLLRSFAVAGDPDIRTGGSRLHWTKPVHRSAYEVPATQYFSCRSIPPPTARRASRIAPPPRSSSRGLPRGRVDGVRCRRRGW